MSNGTSKQEGKTYDFQNENLRISYASTTTTIFWARWAMSIIASSAASWSSFGLRGIFKLSGLISDGLILTSKLLRSIASPI